MEEACRNPIGNGEVWENTKGGQKENTFFFKTRDSGNGLIYTTCYNDTIRIHGPAPVSQEEAPTQ